MSVRRNLRCMALALTMLVVSGAAACQQVLGLEGFQFRSCPGDAVCCTEAVHCDDQDLCTLDTCLPDGSCKSEPAADGPIAEEVSGDCRSLTCEAGQLVEVPKADETACLAGQVHGWCLAGQCQVECGPGLAACDDGNPCTEDTCDTAAGHCIFSPLHDAPPIGHLEVIGDCGLTFCVHGHSTKEIDDTDLPAPPDECTIAACDQGVPSFSAAPANIPCGALHCDGLGNCGIATVWNTGGQVNTIVVPFGQSIVELLVWGGGGGGGEPGPGGGGAWVNVQLPVIPGDVLEVRVASGGQELGGGGGASYVLRNGQIVVVAGGGGGGGADGCSGCTHVEDLQAGTGGAGGPAGGAGQNGWANNYDQTNSGGGGGATQNAGGIPGISNDQNPYGYDECTANGVPGQANQGGAAQGCGAGDEPPASGYLGGGGVGNGSGGGGGSGWFGGGSGASKSTYTGGGGGGGSSWIHPSAILLGTEGGDRQAPGGIGVAGYQGNGGRGGEPRLDWSGSPAQPGNAGLIILKM